MEFHAYQVGRDKEYLKKYGFISVGTMILGGEKFVTRLFKKNIIAEIESALQEMEATP